MSAEADNSFGMHSYEKCACKFFGMHSSEIIGLKVPWNEHLQKKGGGACAYTVTKRPNGHLMYEACAPERELAFFQGASVPEPRGSGLCGHSRG